MVKRIIHFLVIGAACLCLPPTTATATATVTAAAPRAASPVVISEPAVAPPIDPLFMAAVQPATREACVRLAPTRFRNAPDWQAAMAMSGKDWRMLSRVAGSTTESRGSFEVLDIGYRLKCHRPPSTDWLTLPIVTGLAAIFSLIVACVTLAANRASNRFANSVGMYRKYLELCVEHPDLAEPFPDISPSDFNTYRRYEWFVGVLFRACDEVLVEGNRKGAWRETVKDQLRYHHTYIENSGWLSQGGLNLYSKSFREVIEEVKRARPPDERWEEPAAPPTSPRGGRRRPAASSPAMA